MRRISRARSLVSGVELWHPAKPLLENRVVFVHCIIMTACSWHHATLHLSIVIILHLLVQNYFRKNPVLFSTCPVFVQTQTRVSGLFCFVRYRFAKAGFETNKIYNYFSGGSRTGQIDPNDHPHFQNGLPKSLVYPV